MNFGEFSKISFNGPFSDVWRPPIAMTTANGRRIQKKNRIAAFATMQVWVHLHYGYTCIIANAIMQVYPQGYPRNSSVHGSREIGTRLDNLAVRGVAACPTSLRKSVSSGRKLVRSRLYQRRFLRPNIHFAAFFEIYKIFTLSHHSKFKIVAKIRQTCWHFDGIL